MANSPTPHQLALIEQLRPYLHDEAAYGRMYADLHDLLEASAWLLNTFSQFDGKPLDASRVEELLVDIDVKFAEHVSWHLQTLRPNIAIALEQFTAADDEKAAGGR
ncbi:hypothetical protein BH11PSE7_BH11PSE7_36850 [soil metagenome]